MPTKTDQSLWACLHVILLILSCSSLLMSYIWKYDTVMFLGERGGSVVECRTPEREVRGSRPTAAVLCPWARHFTPRKYWLITQEAMAPSRHDWKIVDWDVKPQHNQPTVMFLSFQADRSGQTVQTQISLIRVCTVCNSGCIFWMHYCLAKVILFNF